MPSEHYKPKLNFDTILYFCQNFILPNYFLNNNKILINIENELCREQNIEIKIYLNELRKLIQNRHLLYNYIDIIKNIYNKEPRPEYPIIEIDKSINNCKTNNIILYNYLPLNNVPLKFKYNDISDKRIFFLLYEKNFNNENKINFNNIELEFNITEILPNIDEYFNKKTEHNIVVNIEKIININNILINRKYDILQSLYELLFEIIPDNKRNCELLIEKIHKIKSECTDNEVINRRLDLILIGIRDKLSKIEESRRKYLKYKEKYILLKNKMKK